MFKMHEMMKLLVTEKLNSSENRNDLVLKFKATENVIKGDKNAKVHK